MKLTEYAKKPYTLQETQFFDLLPKDGERISVNELVRKRLKKGKWGTKYPSHVVSVVMRHLMDKIKANQESFVLKRTEQRAGSQEMYYWIVPRGKEKKPAIRSSILD